MPEREIRAWLRGAKVSVGLRWERGTGLHVHTRLPGDVVGDRPVSIWRAIPVLVDEIRWVRNGLRTGEIER